MSLRYPCMSPGMENFSLDLPRAVKNYKERALKVGCRGCGYTASAWNL